MGWVTIPSFFGAVNLVPSYLWHTRPSFTACVTPYMSSPLHFVAPFPSGALANCCQFSSPPSSMKRSTFFLCPILWVFWVLCFLVYNWQFDKLILDDVMRCLTLENTPLGDRSSILSILHPLIWCHSLPEPDLSDKTRNTWLTYRTMLYSVNLILDKDKGEPACFHFSYSKIYAIF